MADVVQHLHPSNKPVDVYWEPIDFTEVFGEITLLHDSPPCVGYAKPMPKEPAHG